MQLRADFLDLTDMRVLEDLRRRFAPLLRDVDLRDFDLGDAVSRNRVLTRGISRWAYDEGYDAIRYESRLDQCRPCWAAFDRPDTSFVVHRTWAITPAESDLAQVMAAFRLM